MKRVLLLTMILLSIIGCKDDWYESISEASETSLLRADFEKQTGYDQSKVYLLSPAFRTRINWDKTVEKHKDTVLIAVRVLDTVRFPINGMQVDLKNRVILKAVRNKDSKWNYSAVIFVPTDLSKGYSGLIISRSLSKGIEKIDYYSEGAILNNDTNIRRKFAVKTSKTNSGLRAKCIYGYVNGMINFVSCDNAPDITGGGSSNNETYGDPDDFEQIPVFDEGSPGETSFISPSEAEIKAQLKDKPFALIPNIPCDIIKKWIATAKFTVDQSTLNRLTQINNTLKPGTNDNKYLTNIQNINSAYSAVVNMDYFPITVNIMPLVNGKVATPEQFLEYIRKDIDKFVDTRYSSFKPYVYNGVDDTNLWNSNNPKNAVVDIDIDGPDNASVIVSKHNSTGWTFTTMFEPSNQRHPVSGNRDFGFVKNSNGSYTFYTRGVDRLTNIDGDNFRSATEFFGKFGISIDGPFERADALWSSFQKGVSDFVNKNGGNAGPGQLEIYRPDWSLVKDVIDGKEPLSSLSTDCED